MKRSHKLRSLGDIDAVLASTSSMLEAARALGVNRSTLHRWIVAGKVKRPRWWRTNGPQCPPVTDPDAWVEAVSTRELSATDRQLVELARLALEMARSRTHGTRVRLAAMGRFQAIVRQLRLEDDAPVTATVPPPPTAPRVVRPAGEGDPRRVLMAVK